MALIKILLKKTLYQSFVAIANCKEYQNKKSTFINLRDDNYFFTSNVYFETFSYVLAL